MKLLEDFTSYMVFRTFFIFASTAFSILVVMLLLNIITIDEVSVILKLSPEATDILKTVFSRVQEVTKNLLDIISQLLNKLFSWAGVDVDLNKIKIDVHQGENVSGAMGGGDAAHHVGGNHNVNNAAGAAQGSQPRDPGLIMVSPQK